MITISKIENVQIKPNEYYTLVEMRGLSNDIKPTEFNNKKIENGSTFIEMDTGKIFMYNLENEEWKEF